MAGYKVREIKSNENGTVDLESLEAALGDDVEVMNTAKTLLLKTLQMGQGS